MRISPNNSFNSDLNNRSLFEKLIDRLPSKNLNLKDKNLILLAVQKNELVKQNKFLLIETYFDNKNKFSTKDFKSLFQTLYGLKNMRDYHQFGDFIEETSDAAANVIAENKAPVVRQLRTNEYARLVVNALPTAVTVEHREMLETDLKDKITEKLQFLESRNSLVFNDENLKKSEKNSEDSVDHGFGFAFRTADYSDDKSVPPKMLKDLNDTQKVRYLALKKTIVKQFEKIWDEAEIKLLVSEIETSSATGPEAWFHQRLNSQMSKLGEDMLKINNEDVEKVRSITESNIKKLLQTKDEKVMADILHTYESSLASFFSHISRRGN